MPAGAQGPPPPNVADAYALLALSKMTVSGAVAFLTGSVGVNEKDGELEVFNNVPLALNTQDGVIASRKASLQAPDQCSAAAFFANDTPGNSADRCGSAQVLPIPE